MSRRIKRLVDIAIAGIGLVPEQARRHDVPPGLTGWAQVHVRALLDFDQRFKLDVGYVDHWSLALDFEIMALTVKKALKGEGLPPSDHAFFTFGGESPRSDEAARGPE